MGLEQAAHSSDNVDVDDTFVTCDDDVYAMGPDDIGGSLDDKSIKEPGRQGGLSVHYADSQLADDHVTGVNIVGQNLPCLSGQSYAVQHGGLRQGQGSQVNVRR